MLERRVVSQFGADEVVIVTEQLGRLGRQVQHGIALHVVLGLPQVQGDGAELLEEPAREIKARNGEVG